MIHSSREFLNWIEQGNCPIVQLNNLIKELTHATASSSSPREQKAITLKMTCLLSFGIRNNLRSPIFLILSRSMQSNLSAMVFFGRCFNINFFQLFGSDFGGRRLLLRLCMRNDRNTICKCKNPLLTACVVSVARMVMEDTRIESSAQLQTAVKFRK